MDTFVLGFVIGTWLAVILKLFMVLNPLSMDAFQAAIVAPLWIIASILLGFSFLGAFGYGLAVAGIVYLIVNIVEVVIVISTAGFAKTPGVNLLLDAVPAFFFFVVAAISTYYAISVAGGEGMIKAFWSFLPFPGV